MTLKIYKEFTAGGFLIIPHVLVNSIDANANILLSRLITEFNYAVNNHYNFDTEFLASYTYLMRTLGLNEKELHKAISTLIDLQFIKIFNPKIEDTIAIRMYTENILAFKEQEYERKMYASWDSGLNVIQNPKHKKTHFCNSTNEIIKIINEHTSKQLPLILYVQLDSDICQYEQKTKSSVLSNKEFLDNLLESLRNNTFDEISLVKSTMILYQKLDNC